MFSILLGRLEGEREQLPVLYGGTQGSQKPAVSQQKWFVFLQEVSSTDTPDTHSFKFYCFWSFLVRLNRSLMLLLSHWSSFPYNSAK